jgi:MFS family permease
MHIYTDVKERFVELFRVLPLRFIMMIVFVEHLFQGFLFGGGAGGLIGVPIMYLLRSYGTLTASRIQILKTIAVSPWALKPLFGMISDTLYLGGYNRMPYIFFTILGSLSACLLIIMTWPVSPVVATLLFFLMFLQIAVSDLLIEARYTEIVAQFVSIGPDLMSFIHIGGTLAQIISIVVVGILITYVPYQYIYIVPLPCLLLLLIPVYYNWMSDTPHEERDVPPLTNLLHNRAWYRVLTKRRALPIIGFDLIKMKENWRIFTLGIVIAMISIATSVIGLFDIASLYLFIMSLVGAPLMIGAFFLLIDHRIAKIQAFVIIQNMFSLSLDSATFFFYVDDSVQYPEGPHFSNFFFITVMGLIGTFLALVGLVTYNMFMTRWSYRKILVMTNLMFIIVSLPNVLFFLRWNQYLGIPDAAFVIGCESIQVITAVWSSFPLSIMMLQLCPPGMEATVYALLAGCSNLGSSLSQYQGAFVLDILGIKPIGAPGESHQFDNLWIAVLISILLPLIPIAFTFILIPDASQTDRLLDQPRADDAEL